MKKLIVPILLVALLCGCKHAYRNTLKLDTPFGKGEWTMGADAPPCCPTNGVVK